MIPRTVATWQAQTWQEQLIDLIRDPAELCDLLELDLGEFRERHLREMDQARQTFELKVPRSFVQRMSKRKLDDPLLLQVLPQGQELLDRPGYGTDPLAETGAGPAPGIIQKYRSRVLLMVTGACAIHCRYCFRRHFPYGDHRQSRADWEKALDAIAGDQSINEVIFSGGDPLAAPDRQLAWFAEQLSRIPHVRTLRIHTRLPIVIPDRIDAACLGWLRQERLRVVMVVHANHPNELDASVGDAMDRLRANGIVLLNQSVLLKGINDKVDVLATLSEKLFSHGILPYYLHLLDKVAGAGHFDLPRAEALTLHSMLRDRLPGYLVPRLAREVPGAGAKQVLG